MKLINGEWRYFDETLNMPYPWFTKPALEFLETIDLNGKRIFEYGVGDSTAWFRAKGAIVYGVDTDYEWAKKTEAKYRPYNGDYLKAIQNFTTYDIVIIDGAWRDECTEYALKHLKPRGLLIIDNWEQLSAEPNTWTQTYELLSGYKPEIYYEPKHEDWKTAVWKI